MCECVSKGGTRENSGTLTGGAAVRQGGRDRGDAGGPLPLPEPAADDEEEERDDELEPRHEERVRELVLGGAVRIRAGVRQGVKIGARGEGPYAKMYLLRKTTERETIQ
jgi:hypothetical protein